MVTFDLVVDNVTPSVTADNATIIVDEGSFAANGGTFFDPGSDVISMTASIGDVSWDDSNNGNWDWAFATSDGSDENQVVIIAVTDSDGAMSEIDFTLTVNNITPTVTADVASIVVEEGSTAVNGGAFSDPGNDLVTMTASVGTITQDSGNNGAWSWSYNAGDGLDESQIVVITGSDNDGATHEISFTMTITNAAPTILTITAPIDPVPLADVASIVVDVAFSDSAGSADAPFTCDFDYNNDGTVDQTVVTNTFACSGTPNVYTEPGVHAVAVTVTDKDGAAVSGLYEFIVLFDSEGGSVSGGGWIYSEAGWCSLDAACAAAEGRASFAFVARYKKGAIVPSGNTQFRFNVGGLTLDSSEYQWLVVNQAATNAVFKGSGMINGSLAPNGEAYQFMIWATDGNGNPDTFHIKIWWSDGATVHTVYDNGAYQPIGGGNIRVHQ
jgi:hypothetical protein